MRRHLFHVASILTFALIGNAIPQEGEGTPADVTTSAEEQDGTVTVYGNGPAVESTSGALVTRTSDSSFFQLPKPASTTDAPPLGDRNPFLLREEQDAGMSRAAMLEAREKDEATRLAQLTEAEREVVVQLQSTAITDSERERAARLTTLRARIETMKARALLLGESGCRAVLDGNVIRVGDSLIDGQVRVEAIDREGIQVAYGDDRFLIALAPVSAPLRDSNENPVPSQAGMEGNERP